MRYDQLAAIENVMGNQAIDEFDDLRFELRRLRFELRERLGQAVGDLNVAATKLPHQLHVMIPRNANCPARLDHRHYKPQNARRIWTSIDQVAEKDRLSAVRMAASL